MCTISNKSNTIGVTLQYITTQLDLFCAFFYLEDMPRKREIIAIL